MIKIKNNYYRNLEEQVQFLTEYHDINQGLVQWGIRVVGQVEASKDLPVPYDGDYGDAIAVGLEAPFFFYIWTRASIEGAPAYWFPFGEISIVGPEGPQGIQGPIGPAGPSSKWYAGEAAPDTTTGYRDGDMYLEANGQIFRFENNTWNSVTNIKGNQGIQGIQGPKGERGSPGPVGPKGEQGDVGGFINIAGIINDFDEYGNPILPTPSELGDLTKAYLVGASTPYDLYIQVGSTSSTATWNNVGPFNAATLVTENGVGLNVFNADTKLDKVTTTTGELRAYCVGGEGNQEMISVRKDAAAYSIVRRTPTRQIFTGDPTEAGHATTKKYVDDIANTKLNNVSSVSGNDRVPMITHGTKNVQYITTSVSSIANSFPRRDANGRFKVGSPSEATDVANKQYIDNITANKLDKDKSVTTYNQAYVKSAQGGQGTINVTKQIVADAIPQRQSDGNIYVPETPAENTDAASKIYVDTAIQNNTTAYELYSYTLDIQHRSNSGTVAFLSPLIPNIMTALTSDNIKTTLQNYLISKGYTNSSSVLPCSGGINNSGKVWATVGLYYKESDGLVCVLIRGGDDEASAMPFITDVTLSIAITKLI